MNKLFFILLLPFANVFSLCYSQSNIEGFYNDNESVFMSEGNWEDPQNWVNRNLPTSTSKVIIKANVDVNTSIQVNELKIDENKTLTISSFAELLVKENIDNEGQILGEGEFILNGDSQQSIHGTGSFTNLRISNPTMVYLNDEVHLYGNLYVDVGNLETKDNLYLKCNFDTNTTAQVAKVIGEISGNVTTEQCYPARRANRLISSSVTTITSIRENWQEDANSYNDYVEKGYGTHITGVNPSNGPAYLHQDGENGFDFNPSGNPSMFQFLNDTGDFAPISNTNETTLQSGAPFMVLVRGDRTVNIYSNSATPTPTRLRAKGELTTGNYSTQDLSKAKNGFSLIGNPYHAQVDMNKVLAKSQNIRKDVYYVWDPKLGGVQNLNQEGGRGAFVVVELPPGSNSSGSEANQYLQPMQAAFVQTLSDNNATQLNFSEDDKVVDRIQTEILSVSEEHFLNIKLYNSFSFQQQSTPSDGLRIKFNPNYSNSEEDDILKLPNIDENFTRVLNQNLVALERRNFKEGEEILPLFVNQYRRENYVMNFETSENFPNEIYLQDHYLGTETLITKSNSTYFFNVSSLISDSVDENRFSLKLTSGNLSTVSPQLSETKLYPNPTNGAFKISGLEGFNNSELHIFNLIGQKVYSQKLGNTSEIEINNFNANAGIYVVKLASGTNEHTYKLVKN